MFTVYGVRDLQVVHPDRMVCGSRPLTARQSRRAGPHKLNAGLICLQVLQANDLM